MKKYEQFLRKLCQTFWPDNKTREEYLMYPTQNGGKMGRAQFGFLAGIVLVYLCIRLKTALGLEIVPLDVVLGIVPILCILGMIFFLPYYASKEKGSPDRAVLVFMGLRNIFLALPVYVFAWSLTALIEPGEGGPPEGGILPGVFWALLKMVLIALVIIVLYLLAKHWTVKVSLEPDED